MESLVQDQIILSKNWAEQLQNLEDKILFVGTDISLHRDVFQQYLGEKALEVTKTEQNPRPSELAFLGYDRPGEDVHSFVPNYIRLAEAEAKWLEAQKEMSTLNGQAD